MRARLYWALTAWALLTLVIGSLCAAISPDRWRDAFMFAATFTTVGPLIIAPIVYCVMRAVSPTNS